MTDSPTSYPAFQLFSLSDPHDIVSPSYQCSESREPTALREIKEASESRHVQLRHRGEHTPCVWHYASSRAPVPAPRDSALL